MERSSKTARSVAPVSIVPAPVSTANVAPSLHSVAAAPIAGEGAPRVSVVRAILCALRDNRRQAMAGRRHAFKREGARWRRQTCKLCRGLQVVTEMNETSGVVDLP